VNSYREIVARAHTHPTLPGRAKPNSGGHAAWGGFVTAPTTTRLYPDVNR